MNTFYSEEELKNIGFKYVGKNVKVSRYALFFGEEKISIGDNSRIDDFCRLSGKIAIGKNVHIAAYAAIFAGEAGVIMEDYSTISSRVIVYAQSDEYMGLGMTNPTIPDEYKQIISERVIIAKHTVIGAASVILPGVNIAEGTACGSMSLVNKDTEPWSLYYGIPAKKRKERRKETLRMCELFVQNNM